MHELVNNVFRILGAVVISAILFLLIFEGVPNPPHGASAMERISNLSESESTLSARSMVFAGFDSYLNNQWEQKTGADGLLMDKYTSDIWDSTQEDISKYQDM